MNATPRFLPPRARTLGADVCLLLAAILWGSGFTAQRVISEQMGPLTFTVVRNLIAIMALLPFLLFRRNSTLEPPAGPSETLPKSGSPVVGALATGSLLFGGTWLQQAGIAHTTAGNAGFITGLYVILVPLLAALAGGRIHPATWLGAVLATAGMRLLGGSGSGGIGSADLMILASAVLWALHVHAIGYFAARIDGLLLATLQLATATLLSLPFAWVLEPGGWAGVRAVLWPLVYSGMVCGAFGFALQIAGQRRAPPSHAAILMSLESVFAALFGALLLGERLDNQGLAGAALMLGGCLVSQVPQFRQTAPARET